MYLEELIPDINIEIRGYRMKKTKFILLTIISLLALSSCENTWTNDNSTGSQTEPRYSYLIYPASRPVTCGEENGIYMSYPGLTAADIPGFYPGNEDECPFVLEIYDEDNNLVYKKKNIEPIVTFQLDECGTYTFVGYTNYLNPTREQYSCEIKITVYPAEE